MADTGAVPDRVRELEQRLLGYRQSGMRIEGWFLPVDQRIFDRLLLTQMQMGVGGAVAEIGVYHGRSFIPLLMSRQPGERAFCVDVFDQQHLNLDSSGQGDYAIFCRNLEANGLDIAEIEVFSASSLTLEARHVVDRVGPVRFFSVDGGHSFEVVYHDLTVAAESLGDGGILALDDMFDRNWPDVSRAFFEWYRDGERRIVPFCISQQKLYLASPTHAEAYGRELQTAPDTAKFWRRSYPFYNRDVPILLDEPIVQTRRPKNRPAKWARSIRKRWARLTGK